MKKTILPSGILGMAMAFILGSCNLLATDTVVTPVADTAKVTLTADSVAVATTLSDWGTSTVQNLAYTSDITYSPCIELKGGASWGAVIVFGELTKGLLSKYTTLDFKIKTSGATTIKVKVPEVEKTYTIASGTSLSGGWTQMKIPLSDFQAVTTGTTSFAIFGTPTIYLADVCLTGLQAYAVTVTVTDGANPVSGVTVGADGQSAVTGTDGNATLNLSNGTYEITAVKTAYYDGTGTVTVSSAATTADVTLITTASAPNTLTVNVHEGAGIFEKHLLNASVTVPGVTKKTPDTGIAAMPVASGSIALNVSKDGYVASNTTVTVSGSATNVDVTLALARTPNVSADSWTPGTGWTLAWNDEFAQSALDTAKWSFQAEAAGKFNSELQVYTASEENCFVTNRSLTDGAMVIQAINTASTVGSGDFTSARMITWGKKDFKYGKVAARIQVPFGQGTWPAFWMLGSNIDENTGGTVAWPKCGEIDIMEKTGGSVGEERRQMGTFHYWNDRLPTANKWEYVTNTKSMTADLSDDFHVYEVEWTASAMVWKIDGVQFHSVDTTNAAYDEFRENFYILLNLAIGGTFDGGPDANTVFPQYMFIDWVRIYTQP